jgi:hypothetical protein
LTLNQRVAGSSPARFTKTPIKTMFLTIADVEVDLVLPPFYPARLF